MSDETFMCVYCGKQTSMVEIGLDEVCDVCFADNYPDLVCYSDNLLTGKTCHYRATWRGDLEEHWDKSPNHNG